jgi:hypothetical protein
LQKKFKQIKIRENAKDVRLIRTGKIEQLYPLEKIGYFQCSDLSIITISPQVESIEWTAGAVPHPRGLDRFDRRIVGDKLRLDYEAPAGVPVVVKLRERLVALGLVVGVME